MSPQKRRNIFGFLLIALLVVPTLSTVLWLSYQKKEVKRMVKNEIISDLSSEELVELTFEVKLAFKELEWENKHEFQYKGKMYDIVSQEIIGNKITYYCWLDKEETALNAKLDNLLELALSGNQSKKSKEYQLEIFLKSMIYQITVVTSNNFKTSKDIDICYIDSFDNIYLNVSSPPPEVM